MSGIPVTLEDRTQTFQRSQIVYPTSLLRENNPFFSDKTGFGSITFFAPFVSPGSLWAACWLPWWWERRYESSWPRVWLAQLGACWTVLLQQPLFQVLSVSKPICPHCLQAYKPEAVGKVQYWPWLPSLLLSPPWSHDTSGWLAPSHPAAMTLPPCRFPFLHERSTLFLLLYWLGVFLHCVVIVFQSLNRVRLFAIQWAGGSQSPLSMGFPRQEYWNGLPSPSPGDLPDPGIEPASPESLALASRFFTTVPPEKFSCAIISCSLSLTIGPTQQGPPFIYL